MHLGPLTYLQYPGRYQSLLFNLCFNFCCSKKLKVMLAILIIVLVSCFGLSASKNTERFLSKTALLSEGDEHEGHGWVGVYEIEEHGDEDHGDHRKLEEEDHDEHGLAYTMELFRGTGWEEPYMLVGCVKVNSSDEEGLEAGEDTIDEAFDQARDSGSATVVSNAGEFDCEDTVEVYNFSLSSTETYSFIASAHFHEHGNYAIMMEHEPSEFADPHLDDVCETTSSVNAADVLLRSSENGEFIAPTIQEPSHTSSKTDNDEEKKWGLPILASIITALPPLFAFLFLGPAYIKFLGSKDAQELTRFLIALGNCFASAVLLATAVFLMLPEASHYIEAGTSDEAEAAGAWGSMICLAFAVSYFIHLGSEIAFKAATEVTYNNVRVDTVVELQEGAQGNETNDKVADLTANALDGDRNSASELDEKETEELFITGVSLFDISRWKPVSYIVSIGDFFHNFVDGMFIAIAFNCSATLGWEVTAITIAHELPQELGDFHVMVSVGGCSFMQAVVSNTVAALSSVLGAVIYLVRKYHPCYSLIDRFIVSLYYAYLHIYLLALHHFQSMHRHQALVISSQAVFSRLDQPCIFLDLASNYQHIFSAL